MAYPKSPAIALWNPVWTVIWSYIFTPVFGAFLQRTNWSEMGETDRTANSHMWMVLGIQLWRLLFLRFLYALLRSLGNLWRLGSGALRSWSLRRQLSSSSLGKTDYARCRWSCPLDDDVFNLCDRHYHLVPRRSAASAASEALNHVRLLW